MSSTKRIVHTIDVRQVNEFEKVLSCCEDQVGRCDYERGAVPNEYTFVGEKNTTFGETKGDLLSSLATPSSKKS
jgi:hypothetical protein